MRYNDNLTILMLLSFFLSGCINKATLEKEDNLEKNFSAAQYNVQLGLEYLNRNDLERAKYKLILANKQDSKSTEAKLAMAYFWEQTGNNDLAEKEYKRALSGNRSLGAAYNNYGVFLCKLNRYKDADHHFNRAVQDKNYTKTAEVLENAGICAMQSDHITEAKNYFSKAVHYDNNRVTALLSLIKIELADKNCSEARKWFKLYEMKYTHTEDTIMLGKNINKCFGND